MTTRMVGQQAEEKAARFLEQLGYKVLRRNFSCRLGEIDLICEQEETLCFVEVRMRRRDRYGEAIETIDASKRKKIALTARYFLTRFQLEERPCRFDVVTIS